jgi:2-C-methyl-D-erythritol 4-phosphate cytidylyltransferase
LPRDVGVVVVAAGRGERAGGTVPKQFREVAGVPLVLRALRPFTVHPDVAHVVVVLPPDLIERPPEWLAVLRGGTLSLVGGGAERSDSAAAGLRALPPQCRVVLVHDGARPFTERSVIDAVIAGAREGNGAVPAVPVSDTLKRVGEEGAAVTGTVPREGLWRAQTPQGFPRALLEAAYARAGGGGATDDAALVEALGAPVIVVPGSTRNLKVTTPDDFVLAELMAKAAR